MGRLLASIWWLSRRQGGPDTCPCCLIAAARKAVIPPAQGQRLLAAQTLHSLSLVRALTSLRCRACGSGPARTAPQKPRPSPCPHPQRRFLSPCIFPAAPRQMHQSFQGWQREKNAKGPGAGTTQTLLPGSPKHRQPSFPAGSLPAGGFTWDRQRPRTSLSEAVGVAERDTGCKGAYLRTTYKDSVSCFGILCPHVQTTWRTGPPSQLCEGLNVGVGSRSPPNKEKTEGAALGGSRLRLVLLWFFQSRKCSSSSSENRRPCRF